MNTNIRHTDFRFVTRRVHVVCAPISDRDQRVLERQARRAAASLIADDHATLGRRVAARVVSIIATLPGVTVVAGLKRPATGRKRPAIVGHPAANEDHPALRAA